MHRYRLILATLYHLLLSYAVIVAPELSLYFEEFPVRNILYKLIYLYSCATLVL